MKKRLVLPLVAGILATALALASAQGAEGTGLARLPALEAGAGLAAGEVLAGTREGLFRLSAADGQALPLWEGGELRKILRPSAGARGRYFLGSRGVVFSEDLGTFSERNAGLPFKTYKRIVEGRKVFDGEVSDLKDLDADPTGTTLLTCTKDEVWLSLDRGLSWRNLGSPSPTTGLKAVALAPLPGTGEPAAWASHPIKGVFARRLAAGSPWMPVTKGLYVMPTMTSPEEVADLVYVPGPDPGIASTSAGPGNPRLRGSLWASNSFQGRLYKAAAGAAEFGQVWEDGRDFGSAESLAALPDGSIRFVSDEGVLRYPAKAPAASGTVGASTPDGLTAAPDGAATALVRAAFAALPAAGILSLAWNEDGAPTALSELWLLAPEAGSGLRAEASGKNALYLQAGFVVNPVERAKNFATIEKKGLNAIVVDIKDDFGRLRYAPRDPLVRSLGRSSNPMEIEALAAEAKARGIWLIGRIPVFKDEALATLAGGKYAVWDSANNRAWQGWRTVKAGAPASPSPTAAPPSWGSAGIPSPVAAPPTPATERVPYGERWVDPYSEEVWAYDVAIANEILARGFDEVQFDYIRFPTDGENLADASYRWRDPGMDRESAIASFLAFARERIRAPISIDIYGANGWYRSGARTGQDVELLARYCDVICPMLYPSHFEQGFLAQAPAADRPWRIYRLGSLRNARIARDRVIVRPYVQAFYLNVSYDRTWYGPDYVVREVQGVREGQDRGMTFWNNVARYDDVPDLGALTALRPAPRPVAAGASAPVAAPAKPAGGVAAPVPVTGSVAAPPTASLAPGPQAEAPPAAVIDTPTEEGMLN